MVRSTVHSADAVNTSRETIGDGSLEETVTIAVVVDTLEEGKLLWVRRGLGGNVAAQILDSNVAMTNDVAVFQCLGCRIIGGGWISK